MSHGERGRLVVFETESVTDLLKRAAALLEQRAAAATQGRWSIANLDPHGDRGLIWVDHETPNDGGTLYGSVAQLEGEEAVADAQWIATMSPDVANPIITILLNGAQLAGNRPLTETGPLVRLAHAILGETGQECRREAGENSMTGASESSDVSRFEEILQQHRSEFGAMLALHARLEMQMLDVDLELLVPASYGWVDSGQLGGSFYGIPFRVVDGIDHLYLAHKVVAL